MQTATPESVALPKASHLFPSRPSVATLWRWYLTGVIGPNGERVKLRTEKIGGCRFVTAEMAQEFIARLNEPETPREDAGAAKRRAFEAGKALAAVGC